MMTSHTHDNAPADHPMINNPPAQVVFRPRTDLQTRDVINQAVASIPEVGLKRAAEFLGTMNVPAETAVRALVYPNRRRVF